MLKMPSAHNSQLTTKLNFTNIIFVHGLKLLHMQKEELHNTASLADIHIQIIKFLSDTQLENHNINLHIDKTGCHYLRRKTKYLKMKSTSTSTLRFDKMQFLRLHTADPLIVNSVSIKQMTCIQNVTLHIGSLSDNNPFRPWHLPLFYGKRPAAHEETEKFDTLHRDTF